MTINQGRRSKGDWFWPQLVSRMLSYYSIVFLQFTRVFAVPNPLIHNKMSDLSSLEDPGISIDPYFNHMETVMLKLFAFECGVVGAKQARFLRLGILRLSVQSCRWQSRRFQCRKFLQDPTLFCSICLRHRKD